MSIIYAVTCNIKILQIIFLSSQPSPWTCRWERWICISRETIPPLTSVWTSLPYIAAGRSVWKSQTSTNGKPRWSSITSKWLHGIHSMRDKSVSSDSCKLYLMKCFGNGNTLNNVSGVTVFVMQTESLDQNGVVNHSHKVWHQLHCGLPQPGCHGFFHFVKCLAFWPVLQPAIKIALIGMFSIWFTQYVQHLNVTQSLN